MLSQLSGLDVVAEASGATDAMAFVRDLSPDLVILDLRMRDGSGFEVLRELRRTSKTTKVIIFTNHPEEQYRRRCAELGADYFLSKSSDAGLLMEITRQLIPASYASL